MSCLLLAILFLFAVFLFIGAVASSPEVFVVFTIVVSILLIRSSFKR